MKLKRIIAIASSIMMMATMISSTVASAASTLYNEQMISMEISEPAKVAAGYTVQIGFHYGGRIKAINGAALKVVVPEALKSLITNVEWTNVYPGKKITPSTSTSNLGRYILQGTLAGDTDTTSSMSNASKDIAKLTLTLSALPETEQTISLSTEAKSNKVNYQASVTDDSDITYYCFKGEDLETADTTECPVAARKANLFNIGSSVVVKAPVTETIPTATEATPVYDGTPANWQGTEATAIGDTYVSDTDPSDTAVAYGVGLKGTGDDVTRTKVIWKVTANGVTKGHEMILDTGIAGAGTAKVGLAIQGLTSDEVTSVQAAFGN